MASKLYKVKRKEATVDDSKKKMAIRKGGNKGATTTFRDDLGDPHSTMYRVHLSNKKIKGKTPKGDYNKKTKAEQKK